MMTAAQIRELMTASHSQILKQIECKIEDAAREGRSEVEIFINQEICNWPTARAIVDELIENGYKAKREYIADQRDGNIVKFEIEW